MPTRPSKATVRILSWNVNGLRAAAKKGFVPWLARSRAEIVGLQELRAQPDDLPPELSPAALQGKWHVHYAPAKRKGYSGVALFSRRKPDWIETSLGAPRFDREGRLQIARFGRLIVVNSYFPNGNGKERDNSRVPYKLAFYRAVYKRVDRLRRGGYRVLVMGDFNTAHREIDLARPVQNKKTSGFLPVERAEIDRWLRAGWVDSFRRFEPAAGHYSWWSQRQGARERNVGWRLDYILASHAAMRHVRSAFIQRKVLGSDHCPVGVDLDPQIFGSPNGG